MGVDATRYRCRACGNITRFDVSVTRTTRSFHHYSVGGELVVDDVEVQRESVDEVSCRWCGHGRDVEVLGDTGEGSPLLSGDLAFGEGRTPGGDRVPGERAEGEGSSR